MYSNLQNNFYKKPILYTSRQHPSSNTPANHSRRSMSSRNQSTLSYYHDELNYDRQASQFRCFAIKDKLKSSRMNQNTGMGNESSSLLSPIDQQINQNKDEQLRELRHENQELKMQISQLRKKIAESNKCMEYFVRESSHQTVNQLEQNSKIHQKTQGQESRNNLFNLSESLQDQKDEEIVSLLKDAQHEIKEKNYKIQKLLYKVQQLESLIGSRQKLQKSERLQSLEGEPENISVNMLLGLRDKLNRLGEKEDFITDRLEWLEKQMKVVTDKFFSIISLMRQSQSSLSRMSQSRSQLRQ